MPLWFDQIFLFSVQWTQADRLCSFYHRERSSLHQLAVFHSIQFVVQVSTYFLWSHFPFWSVLFILLVAFTMLLLLFFLLIDVSFLPLFSSLQLSSLLLAFSSAPTLSSFVITPFFSLLFQTSLRKYVLSSRPAYPPLRVLLSWHFSYPTPLSSHFVVSPTLTFHFLPSLWVPLSCPFMILMGLTCDQLCLNRQINIGVN